MKTLISLLFCFHTFLSFGQQLLPFYYEKNLPLYGKPVKVSEYYYEYHSQAKAHYYNHQMTYDDQGRIKTHVKSNAGLLDLDNIPLPFHTILDLRPVTITYSFKYDGENRLVYFTRNQFQEEVGTYQQDEEWKYDAHGMLTEHNFWEVGISDTILKNPSFRRTIFRDGSNQVHKIEKAAYSFSAKDLVVSEITGFTYRSGFIDTIFTYRVSNGIQSLVDKKYNITFRRYDPLNTDSVLFDAYSRADQTGQVTLHMITYDRDNRKIRSVTTTTAQDTIALTEWTYDLFRTVEETDGYYTLETYHDETGYETYREEFQNGSSLAKPSEYNTRLVEDGKIKHALLEIWDPVTLFYRKDTEYIFEYDVVSGLTNSPEPKICRVFPNPSRGILHIENTEGITRLELISADGKSVMLPVANVLTPDVPKGIYILCASYQDSFTYRTKIVITD